VSNGVLDKVSHGITDGVAVPPHHDGLSIGLQRYGSFPGERPGRHRGHNFGGNIIEIDSVRNIQRDCVQSGNAQKLIYEPVHPRYIGFDLRYLTVRVNDIEGGCDNGKRRAQLMGCIRGELTLNLEALFEALQRAIDRGDQGGDLTW